MKRQWMVFVAAMTALSITACGNGDSIVINGTRADEVGSSGEETPGEQSQETKSGTMIEIVTDETSPAAETAAQSTEGYSQETVSATVPQTTTAPQTAPAPTEAPRPAATQAASATRPAAQPETTAARTYKVTDTKKTMYATASVRVRSSYSTSSSVLAGLAEGEKVEVTGESENGWLRVNYKGNVGYVSKSYLTEQVPESTAQLASGGQSSGGNTSSGAGGGAGNSQGNSSSAASQSGNSGNSAGPGAAGTGNSTSGGKTGPGGNTGSGNTSSSGTSVGPGGSGSPGQGSSGTGPSVSESSAPANNSSGNSGNSVTGSVTALDPSGVTIQTSNGATYQFVWGDDVPALAPGEKIQIFYETTGSGERRVVSYSK